MVILSFTLRYPYKVHRVLTCWNIGEPSSKAKYNKFSDSESSTVKESLKESLTGRYDPGSHIRFGEIVK